MDFRGTYGLTIEYRASILHAWSLRCQALKISYARVMLVMWTMAPNDLDNDHADHNHQYHQAHGEPEYHTSHKFF